MAHTRQDACGCVYGRARFVPSPPSLILSPLPWPCCVPLRQTSGTQRVPGSVDPSSRRGPRDTEGRERAEGGMQGCSVHVSALPKDHREVQHRWAEELRAEGGTKAGAEWWAQVGRPGIPGAEAGVLSAGAAWRSGERKDRQGVTSYLKCDLRRGPGEESQQSLSPEALDK